MDQPSATTAAQDREKETPDQEPGTARGPEAVRDSENPAGTEEPHQEEQWESEGGNPA